MDFDPAQRDGAALARDARHDRLSFAGVKTTGIYCRPVRPARLAKFENCRFAEAADALAA
jgi:AraC family transcriptional regulator of adaptative response / DNA-3-methyladenine glycosylase II